MEDVDNALVIKGDKKVVDEVMNFISNELMLPISKSNTIIDFNKVVPIEEKEWKELNEEESRAIYETRIKRWGTGGVAFYAHILNSNTITFTTGWSPATAVIIGLSTQFPTVEFDYMFTDWRDIDSPYYHQFIKDGVILYSSWDSSEEA